jgi:cytochrome c peroxidase
MSRRSDGKRAAFTALLAAALACGACDRSDGDDAQAASPDAPPQAEEMQKPQGPDAQVLRERALAIFRTLPSEVSTAENPLTEEKIELGRMLYYESRISKSHEFSCNSCHLLDRYGVDGEPTSLGHRGQRGTRNSPTVYNAALHVAQFWDGRAPTLEEQAKGPVLNPVEMGMPSEDYVLTVLRSIPGYAPLFHAAFPGEDDPITYENAAKAIGAFERKLMTPGSFDAFLGGDTSALTDEQLAGLQTFLDTGCVTCHNGPAVGGGMYQKLGVVKPYATEDLGRYEVTKNEADKYVFKVPSLRNITQTGPYLHDGSIASLDEMIRIMGEHQLGKSLAPEEVASIHAFLRTLTGRVDASYVAKPTLPESGPDTPAPDPS